MIIVSGWLRVDPQQRETFLSDGASAVQLARSAMGCLDFAVSADSVDPGRVNVHERWESEIDLLAFRGDGPDDAQQIAILDADVRRYEISSEGPA